MLNKSLSVFIITLLVVSCSSGEIETEVDKNKKYAVTTQEVKSKANKNKAKPKVIKSLKKYPPSDPVTLLGQAISFNQQINSYIPVVTRLELYENSSLALDRIINEHPGSMQAIQILSRQSIGEFNPASVSTKYISELSDYYDKICEVTFSAKCLGFVSLKKGTDECSMAESYNEALSAHLKILNAAKFFISHDEKDTYISLALNEYRKCSAEFDYLLSRAQIEYFNVLLLDVMLSVYQVETARAIIQNMTTPYYKFGGVIKLRLHEGNGLDIKTIDSLNEYIRKNIEGEFEQIIAHIILTTEIAKGPVPEIENPKQLLENLRRKLSPLANKIPTNIRAKKVQVLHSYINNLQAVWWDNTASTGGLAEMGLIGYPNAYSYSNSYIYGLLLPRLDREVAKEFLTRSIRENWSRQDMQDYLMPKLSTTETAYKETFMGKSKNGRDKTQFYKFYDDRHGKFLMFKKEVDYGYICKSAAVLFNTIKKTKYYDDAIKYMIESPSIDPSVDYKCGDEELKLLLS